MKYGRLLLLVFVIAAIAFYTTHANSQTAGVRPSTTMAVQQVQPKIITTQAAAPVCWNVTGNVSTNPSVNFIGTVDAQPLILRAGNLEQMRVAADGNTWVKKLMLGYSSGGYIEFYSAPNNVRLSSSAPGTLAVTRAQGTTTGLALDVSGDIRASGNVIGKAGITFPDGTVQKTASRGISGAKVDQSTGNLVLTMTDNTTFNAGVVKAAASSGSMIAGEVLANGTIKKGKGFTVSHAAGTGKYILDFPNAYQYICVAMLPGGAINSNLNIGQDYQNGWKPAVWVKYQKPDKTMGNIDGDFNFICMMP